MPWKYGFSGVGRHYFRGIPAARATVRITVLHKVTGSLFGLLPGERHSQQFDAGILVTI
jgi:hypothetical protein